MCGVSPQSVGIFQNPVLLSSQYRAIVANAGDATFERRGEGLAWEGEGGVAGDVCGDDGGKNVTRVSAREQDRIGITTRGGEVIGGERVRCRLGEIDHLAGACAVRPLADRLDDAIPRFFADVVGET